jgi:membrane-associated phospholipid phosphatase
LRRTHPLLLLGALLALGAALGAAVYAGGLLPGDVAVARELQEQRPIDVVLLPLMVLVSAPGNDPWAETLFVGAVALLVLERRWAAAVLVALTVVADVLAATIKLVVARPRPTPDLVEIYRQVSGYSFPSGHVVHYVVFYGVIGYLAWRTLPSSRPNPWLRRLLQIVLGVCCALVLLVGPSRVFLGAHWPTDVLGGYLLGGACLLLVVAGHEWWTTRAGTSAPKASRPASAERRLRSAGAESATPASDHPDARVG